ncbi:MAG TPA: hypothetical protein VE967_03715 [Gemmatimonadaceae bacterium]|nr:hypothetical protein [Gemmatimonadaceae bacterium]
MAHVDEGLVHAWLDGQLPADDAARVEQLVATDPAWGAAAAEARGLIAGATRILGALDDVPNALPERFVAAAAAPVARMERAAQPAARPFWRTAGFRAAAGLVLVAGVATLVSRQRPETVSPAAQVQMKEQAHIDTLSNADRASAGARAQPSVVTAPPAQTPPKALAQKATLKRDSAASEASAKAADAPQRAGFAAASPVIPPTAPPVTPPAALRDSAKPPATVSANAAMAAAGSAAGAGAASDTAAQRVANDLKQGAAARAAGGLAGGGGGGRGGRGGGRGGRPVSATTDSVLAGCWEPIDIPDSRVDRDAFVLRFVDPTVTDALRIAAPLASRAERQGLQLQPVSPNLRVQNATPRKLNDSTYVTEWIQNSATVQLTFSVRRDTLRGQTVRVAGDAVSAAPPLTAVRRACAAR